MWEKERVTYVGAHPAGTASKLRRGVATITGVGLAGAFIALGGAASATPNPTASQVRAKINKLMSQLDAISEQYDQSITDLKSATAKLQMIDRTLGEDRSRLDTTRVAVAQIASAAYEQGSLNSVSAVLTSDNPQVVLDQAALLNQLSAERRAQLAAYVSAANTVVQSAQQQARITAAISQLKTSKQAQSKRLKKLVAKNRKELNKLTAPAPTGGSGGTGGRGTGGSGGTGGSSGGGGGIVYSGPATGAARTAVAFAMAQIGKPYVWGGTGPDGFDCSGLVMTAWANAGVQIPRTTYSQWAALPHTSTSSIQPGDLLYYDGEGHVAMYVGNNMIVDAPQPGENVEEIPMDTSWYTQTFDGVARP
ncbi:MAG TPA: NlpC/P60 family protein [Streptosporangiaceae bacterium]|nr:NlpC/P60 family protein [Streptosporangiaceae bacterium]